MNGTKPATPARLAERDDVIAVFVFAVNDYVYTLMSQHGDQAPVWRAAVSAFVSASVYSNADDKTIMRIDDAQILYYIRHENRAMAVVLPPGSKLLKSAKRTMQVALEHIETPNRRPRRPKDTTL